MKYFNFKFSIFTVLFIDVVFQIINLIYFIISPFSNGRIINNLMILSIILFYISSIKVGNSRMNRFQFFISTAILFSLKDLCDDTNHFNVFYLICLFIFNLAGIYDVFFLKKDYGKFFFDFIYFKNWL